MSVRLHDSPATSRERTAGAEATPSLQPGSSGAVRSATGRGPSILEVVVGPSGLEVYERAGEGAVGALEERLRALGLMLRVRRRTPCG